ncbi:MAG: bifunctional methylenetetrahydrofolate dehydrogenase/methenyltetrahydrofolate cyclohydrolase FolD [Pseudolabrys sp.]|jgi:methylenetetrahydrofolate dehydrogenase (NADP+)/methenyltetrahydrofolate cyclohydrolase
MTAKLLDGKAIAQDIRTEIKHRVAALRARTGVMPMLSVILVGQNPASRVYVRNKIKACADAGIRSALHEFPADVDPAEVIARIEELNRDPQVHGILVQLPLPTHHDIHAVLRTIAVEKDVDGFHLYNVGGLVLGETVFPPCTPYGVMKLLDSANIDVAGKNVTIVGASNIVGKPMALMMLRHEATVAICHVRTRDLAQYTILADILIVAAGVPNLIVPQMVKSGAVVIDVGINRLSDGRLVGDIDFEGIRKKAAYVTPVPGGIGPMTVTMLLENTLVAAERATLGAASLAPIDEALEQAE